MSYYKQHAFFCCNNRNGERASCEDHGARTLRDYAKQRIKELGLAGKGGIRVNVAGCLDRCAEGPVMVIYPDAVWYTYRSKSDIDEIIDSHLLAGQPVDRLKI